MSRAEDFSPPLLRIRQTPPAPLAGWTLRVLLGLIVGVIAWATFGKLDIVAIAEGKLVPAGYLKIVQPAEQGIIKEILVGEGQAVKEGQVLARMDPVLTQADVKVIRADYQHKRLALRRVDTQLSAAVLRREPQRILIFDEATSSLDQATAEKLAQTINKLKSAATLLFIAHQLPKGLAVDEIFSLTTEKAVQMRLVEKSLT